MTYTCDRCKGTFESKWSDAEAQAEYSIDFPAEQAAGAETAVLCDDCYSEFMKECLGRGGAVQ